MEEQIKEWLEQAQLKSKNELGYDPYGIYPDGKYITYYWDEYRNEWASKDRALEGYILNKILPIIHNEIINK